MTSATISFHHVAGISATSYPDSSAVSIELAALRDCFDRGRPRMAGEITLHCQDAALAVRVAKAINEAMHDHARAPEYPGLVLDHEPA